MMLLNGLVIAYVCLTAVTPSSAISLRRGDGREEESNQKLASSMWPFPSNIKSGITFERTETSCPLLLSSLLPGRFQIMEISPQAKPSATFDSGHCKSVDQFGGNDCHYKWGDDITIKYDADSVRELDENVYAEISLKIDNLVHHKQTCPICGDKCTINIPALPKSNWSIDLPPCPIIPKMLDGEWTTKLPNKNPIPSLLNGSSGTVVEATVWLKKRKGHGDDGGLLLMKVKGDVHLK